MAGQMPVVVVVVSPLLPWTAVRHLSHKTRKVSTGRPGLAHFLPATLVPILSLCYCHLVPSIGHRCSPMGPTATVVCSTAAAAATTICPTGVEILFQGFHSPRAGICTAGALGSYSPPASLSTRPKPVLESAGGDARGEGPVTDRGVRFLCAALQVRPEELMRSSRENGEVSSAVS